MDFEFFLRSILLGIGLSMDAFALSIANGLGKAKDKKNKGIIAAAFFGLFQGLMPLVGYFIGHAILSFIGKFIPWIALIILSIIGINMTISGIKNKDNQGEIDKHQKLTITIILLQALATSIDALSVGFTISNYTVIMACICSLIIALITFAVCVVGSSIGKKFGMKLGNRAEIFGGIILIGIAVEIFITGIV